LRNILHDFDARKPSSLNKRDPSSFTPLLHGQRQILPCFSTQTVTFSQRVFAPGRRTHCNSRSGHGSRVYGRNHRFFIADAGFGRGLRGTGKKEVTWAYVLSGLVSLALLVYLLIALIFAEDL
jgi:K+-transporting ATPase KdpF subunit